MPRRSTRHPAFQHGVGSFDPTPEGVLLWTLVSGAHGSVRWELAADEGFDSIVQAGETAPDPGAGTVRVDVTGLEPATTYWYRFRAGSDTSPVGRTRTLPGPAAERLRIGVACCARFSQHRFGVYRALADDDLDVVLHLGDYIYEDAHHDIREREPDPPRPAVTLADYRARHRQHRSDVDLQALHARHPMIAIWDDHDLADNAWATGARGHDPEKDGPWSARLAVAIQAHNEFLPKRLADPDDPSSCWRRLDAGDLVSIVCTESRAHRDEPAGLGGGPPADARKRTLLGDPQRTWVLDNVRDRSATWLLLASGVVVSELEIPMSDALDGLLPEKYSVVDDRGVNTDQWDGYRAERLLLAEALQDRHGGTIILSGDIHSAWAIDGPVGPGGVPVAVELVCPPAATTPLGQLLPPGLGTRAGPLLSAALPRVRWVDVEHRGHIVLDVTRDECSATWWWVDDDAGEAVRARTWRAPRRWPAGLIDPEPVAARVVSEAAARPSAGARRARRRRLAVTGALAGAVALIARRARRD